ncbi:hypothetical protein Hokovirus_4_79 [Hokovirus HKV1]|uniref:Uncharacterized protein n=1 Tax=Hokovirus HKV1 TaxID=1977638 RepID=A0A1V0SHB1_9VIRU|nr:hypothetical protein Hokovirus_4_79 [Hokovirus HKV1]
MLPSIRKIAKFNVIQKKNNNKCDNCNHTSINFYHKDNITLCRYCYIVTSLNYGYLNEVELYYSRLSQLDIIAKTREYYNNNKIMPKPEEIDINIKKSDISLIELIYLLKGNIKFDNSNYKIFFTDNFLIDFDTNNRLYYDFDFDNFDDDINSNKDKKNKIRKKTMPIIKTKNTNTYVNFFQNKN